MTEPVSLFTFYDMLERHDWYHSMSDDRVVHERGKVNWFKLEQIANQSLAHEELLEAYNSYMWTGKPWDGQRAPKPDKPKE